MPLESGSTISALDSLWPLSGDDISQGDDHLRLIKDILKKQFPSRLPDDSPGEGLTEPVNATAAEINGLVGFQYNWSLNQWLALIQLDYKLNFYAPAGTVMLFAQANAPVGWTKLVSEDNRAIRLSASQGGGIGGTDNPFGHDFEHTHSTFDYVLTEADVPAHSHRARVDSKTVGGDPTGVPPNTHSVGEDANADHDYYIETSSFGGGGPHNHGDVSIEQGIFEPRYMNVIACIRDAPSPIAAPGP